MVLEGLVLDRPASVNLGVARGTYTEIVEIVAPASATAGELVSVAVRVKNIDLIYDHVVACVALYDSERFIDLATIILSGDTYSFSGSFTMPNKDVTIYAWSYYPYGEEWIADDSAEKRITLAVAIGWQLLDSKTLTIRVAVAPPVGWQELDSTTLSLQSAAPPLVGWQELDSMILTVNAAVAPPVGWQPLDTMTLGVAAGPLPPEYELIQHVIEPWAYFYEGDAEIVSMSFTLIKGTTWLAKDMANRFVDELKERGSQMLEGEFYKDASSIIQDRYLVKITYVVPAGAGAIGAIGLYIPPLVWNIIFYAALGALVAFLVSRAVNWVKSMFYSPPPLSEDVKKQWQAEDPELIPRMIIALRPAYSPEELAGKTDQELRDVLDEIYEEEVPPKGIPWWGWAILGGVGIAGGGLALSFVSRVWPKKKKEA